MAEPESSNTSQRHMSPQSIVTWVIVALVGAVGWSVLALSHGEEISAVWMLAAALGPYAMREVSGESVYDQYVARARSHGPGAKVMSRREFERSRMDAREADPREGFRCC